MKIFKTTPQWDILGKRKISIFISSILVLAAIVGLAVKGLTYGIDFRGGTLIQIKFQEKPDLGTIRDLFQRELSTSVSITTFGEEVDNEVIVTLSEESMSDKSDKLANLVHTILSKSYKGFTIRRNESVGPKVGDQLKTKAVEAALYCLAGILIYIGFRFKPRYGIGAVVALFHDVLITLGIFVFVEKEFTLTIVAAVLTIIGYSLNDTIIVFDRIRENTARFPKRPLEEVINLSINETLSRTILTSFTTFLVVFALFVLGGDIIHDFAFAMLIGLVVGTYSSVFVASPVVMYFDPDNFSKTMFYRVLIQNRDRVQQLFTKRKRVK
ncbi:protein translocase subunit SecF [bacterium]|nr:protein translocase subunit SecF [bacterium]